MEPVTLSWVMVALRKKMDLKKGTQKETTARSTVAVKVQRKPGVAGRRQPIAQNEEERVRERKGEDASMTTRGHGGLWPT
jgi:hypothetical protein